MKLISWNVNGVRAIIGKGFEDMGELFEYDVICLQETKAQDDQVHEALATVKDMGYELYVNSAEKKGYSGTAILTKLKPESVSYDISVEEFDSEGRVTCVEYKEFYLVNVYVPNSGSELKRLEYRGEWDKAFCAYLKELEKKKPVVVCGDMNVAHTSIDLANPKSNYNKSAGYMQLEIDGMDRFMGEGFVDTYRMLYPEELGAYSWWSYRGGARTRNVGWRIDYFLVSESMKEKVKEAKIHQGIMGSDHCPVSVILG